MTVATSPLPRQDWRTAWQRALYGEGGFYRGAGGPAAHFSTATHGPTGALLAEALLRLLPEPPALVVDVGAGRGELARHLVAAGAQRVLAVDVVPRPDDLPADIEWLQAPGGADLPSELDGIGSPTAPALVVAHEWLDVVPCTIAQVDPDGVVRQVLVDPGTGVEWPVDSSSRALDAAELAWVRRFWSGAEPGERVEVGSARDAAWADLVSRVRHGIVVAIDYGHTRETRPAAGTLTAFRSGREVRPVPDGSCDLTAHVAVDSLDHDVLLRQRDALSRLGLRATLPEHALAATDPLAYVGGIGRSNAVASLRARGAFGDFWWVVRTVGSGGVLSPT